MTAIVGGIGKNAMDITDAPIDYISDVFNVMFQICIYNNLKRYYNFAVLHNLP
jgi:hypothetical protein